jgi:predicted transcriptional regulator
MKSSGKIPHAKLPKPSDTGSTSVTLRVDQEHLEKLDQIAKSMGLKRSGAIKVAIAEMIERRGK